MCGYQYNSIYKYEFERQEEIKESKEASGLSLNEKNISYGDSALSPARIFSQADSVEQLKVRIDDKLNRVMHNQGYAGDNDVDDLIGYLVLYKIAKSV